MQKLPTLLLSLLFTALPARAAPDTPPGDTVLQLLQEKGLISGSIPGSQPGSQPGSLPGSLPGLLTSSADIAAQIEASPLVRQVRDTATGMVVSAMNFLGVRYKRGGSSAEQGFDCSGFTRYVFENSLGLVLPRRADQQAKNAGLLAIKQDELKPGDLVFFNTMRRAFSHVGIYVGEGKFIHAPRAGGQVRIEDMRGAYWTKRFNGARRADMAELQTTAQQ